MQKYIKYIQIAGQILAFVKPKKKNNIIGLIHEEVEKNETYEGKILVLQKVIQYAQTYQSTLMEVEKYENDLKIRKDERSK